MTYGGDHIPKSPFNVAVAPSLELSKINVTGLGDSTYSATDHTVAIFLLCHAEVGNGRERFHSYSSLTLMLAMCSHLSNTHRISNISMSIVSVSNVAIANVCITAWWMVGGKESQI